MRLRRLYGDRYLARGRFKGIEIQTPRQLTDREHARIEKLSRREPIAVLDPTTRVLDHFAVAGCFALDPEWAESHLKVPFDTALTHAYRAAFVVDNGVWTSGVDWLRRQGWDHDRLPRFLLREPRGTARLDG
jgi:hypothetical protein